MFFLSDHSWASWLTLNLLKSIWQLLTPWSPLEYHQQTGEKKFFFCFDREYLSVIKRVSGTFLPILWMFWSNICLEWDKCWMIELLWRKWPTHKVNENISFYFFIPSHTTLQKLPNPLPEPPEVIQYILSFLHLQRNVRKWFIFTDKRRPDLSTGNIWRVV